MEAVHSQTNKHNELCLFVSSQCQIVSVFICASLTLLLWEPGAMASNVRGDINYQDYRDFGENRGRFVPGVTNIPVYNKVNGLVGVLNGAPMPDFSAANRIMGVATLVAPQYLFGVRHNGGYGSVQFGGSGNNPGYRRHTYVLVDRNNSDSIDIHTPRLDKVVTDVAPAGIPAAGMPASTLLSAGRFPLFYRTGSGTQSVDGSGVSGAYSYLTGGTVARPTWADWRINIVTNMYNVATDGPLGNKGAAGDSGSPLFAWDAQQKSWLLVGALSTGGASTAQYVVVNTDFLNARQQEDTDGTVAAIAGGGNIRWSYDASAGTGVLTQGSASTTMHGLSGSNLNAGKDLVFGPLGGQVVLGDSVNQGAGALTFQGKWTVAPQAAQTWQGGGLITAAGSDITWQVSGVAGDSLHKVGPGTLRVNGIGVNPGELSAGEGTVVLEQRADGAGRRQAFSAVDIVSGRPTVVLTSTDQINPDNLYFGYRGGRLDLNGNSLTFHRINAVDDGARIVNQGTTTATATATGTSWTQWQAGDGGYSRTWSSSLTGRPGTLYMYDNPYTRRREYFQLKTTSYGYFPINGTSNASWTYLGTTPPDVLDRQRYTDVARSNVYPGRLGEDDPSRPNQRLSFTWNPDADGAVLAVTGGANLNGSLIAAKGVLLLSGHPVLHANNVTIPDDWTVSVFRSMSSEVSAGASLQVGEYAAFQTSGLTAWNGARVVFGYNSSTDSTERLWRCTLDDNSGVSACNQPQRSAQEQTALPLSLVSANITLAQDARLTVGQALWSGRLASFPTAVTSLFPGAVWQVSGDSHAGILRALPGSTVDLAVATEGRWQPRQLVVQRLEATGLTVGLGADMAGRRADRLDILEGATGGNNVLQVSFLSGLPGTMTSGDSLVLATAPAGTSQDYFSLTPINQGFTTWCARLQSQENFGRRVWAISPVSPSARSLLVLRSAAQIQNAETRMQVAPGVAGNATSSAQSSVASSDLTTAAGTSQAVPAAPGTVPPVEKDAVSLPLLLAPVWFVPEENKALTVATRRQLSTGDSLLAGLAATGAQRPTDLMLSGDRPGTWATLAGSRTDGGRSGTAQTLSFGADTGEGGLLYGLAASIVQAKNDSDGKLSTTAKAYNAGAWVTVRSGNGWFAGADLRALRLDQNMQPDASLVIPQGGMNQTGVAGRLWAGQRYETADSSSVLAPWAGISGNWLSGARLAGEENAVSRRSGTSLWYGAGLDARHIWRVEGGRTLVITGGMNSMWRAIAPGVTLEDATNTWRYDAMSHTQQTVYAGLQGTLTKDITISLLASRRDDGVGRERTATAGLQWSF